MKANEFIKKYGLDTFEISMGFINTRKFLVVYEDEIDFTDVIMPYHGNCVYDRKEVKRFVKSHDLVEKIGGLEKAKKFYRKKPFELAWSDLGRAIADVESCQ